MKDNFFNLFNDNPSLISHCPVCHFRFDPLEAKVIREGNSAHLVSIQCRHCQASLLALISVGNLGINSIGLVSDLSSEDAVKFQDFPAVSFDDVIETHQYLTKEKVLINHWD